MFLADAMGFLSSPGQAPVADKDLKLDLVHVTSVKPWLGTMEEVLADHRQFKRTIEEQPRLTIVRTRKDLINFNGRIDLRKKTGVLVLMGMQNTPRDPDVKVLFEAGIRVITPAYQKENDLGSGWINAGIGLKTKGVDFVRECAKWGIILDLSHLGHQMARDVIKIVKEERLPLSIVASHGGCYSQYHHMRNLPDDVLIGVAEAGGVVGITLLTFTLDERNNNSYVYSFLRHLYHAIKICGETAVVVGSDVPYVKEEPAAAEEKFLALLPRLDPDGTQGARFPEYVTTGPDFMKEVYSWLRPGRPPSLSLFYELLVPRTEPAADRIMGLNFFRFLERALPNT